MPNVTGPDLRRERRAAELTVIAVASKMNLSRQTIHNLERSAAPETARVEQYRQALDDLRAATVSA